MRGAQRPAIVVDGVAKVFRLYHERNQSLKASIMRRRRAGYEELMALDGVSLEVAEGSTIGFIGPNGSGKSTLLKCIARILRPDRGSITVAGKVSALLELGAGFHPELSGRENIFLNGTILGLSTKELQRKFDGIVDFAGLARFIDQPVKNYSSGMYVRLGFSVAINVDPDVLLVDEVLAVGDESFQRRCAEKFAELKAAGKTIVLVSHSLGSVRSMCDEAVWLEAGRIAAQGDPASVVDTYLAAMHEARAEGGGLGRRWGSQTAVIERIEVLDGHGRQAGRVCTGDALTIRLRFRAPEPIPRPLFSVAIHTLEGFQVTSPNNREAGVVPEKIAGEGSVELHVERLMLLPGTYDVSASLQDEHGLHTFDSHQRSVRFDVGPGAPHETFGGVVSLGGTWSVRLGG